MYSLITAGKETKVFFPRPEKGATISFTAKELEPLINRLLSRKERNNGVGRGYIRENVWKDGYIVNTCSRYVLKDGVSGFRLKPSFTFADRFELVLFGDVEVLLGRLNGRTRYLNAKPLRSAPQPARRPKPKALPRALPGANGKVLHWHFRRHDLLWDDAVRILAKAAGRSESSLRRKLRDSLDDRGVASIRLSAGFSVRIDVACVRSKCFDLLAPIQLRTTDDNRQKMYRRLRMLLKEHFDCVPKTRQEAEAAKLVLWKADRLASRYA